MRRRATGDPEGRLRLHQAAVAGRAGEVARLIADGEDVAAVDKALLTPLHMACQQGHLEVARVLLAAGAPVDARDSYGNTPLWKAVFAFQGGEPELIRLLLDAGADPDCKNTTDRSPRDMAVTFDRPGIRSVFP
jgi:ankyrin repeat protein